ncbi:MAG: leucyl aminopeptidase [Rhodovulum sp.]|jgi:leucyl aminopeptidase|nr:leucyl aminopeptidase [Rhodovulum sp.]|tara:strand:+ start:541 stop:1926 length:1386 start_codon:yes stop_codon:yes gene_type:complete
MPFEFAAADAPSVPVYIIADGDPDGVLGGLPASTRAWATANGFTGAIGQALTWADGDGAVAGALIGYGTPAARARGRFHLAAGAAKLPEGTYHLATDLPADVAEVEVLGWALMGYTFARYRDLTPRAVGLKAPAGVDADRILAMVQGEVLTRDLINTPAADMGPADLEQAARDLAGANGASINVTVGEDLIAQNFPMIHAVGRAAETAPRLIDMRWGETGPKLTLVGKGVCFDTGGLNLKPGSSMGLMKKDMGGSATVLGLAHMIMALKLPVQLRVLIPAVENSVAGNAFRPQDILTSRKGLTVEINNTDAEGRLVLADALTYADEDAPDLVISMATLTGAARVAVGPDIAPFYVTDDTMAASLSGAAQAAADPVWQMPFYEHYEAMLDPGIADLDNAPKGGFAGSITAALFLRRFVGTDTRYAHFDIYGWQPAAAPARPKGGVGQGARAILAALPDLLNL